MTLANKLTLVRLGIAPAAFICIWAQRPALYATAFALFLAATATDWVDGWVARRTKSVSPFGVTADPLADKVLVIGALIAFVRIPEIDIPPWAVFFIIVRELLIGGLRALAGMQGVLLAADSGGKFKMVVQSVSILAILALLVVWSYGWLALPGWTRGIPYHLVVLSMIVSILSGGHYLYTSRRMLRKSWNAPENEK
ncbi:MAG: CDP-alcohol phosphatidyltransferase family protein [Elusimicrobiota bacterium]